MPTEASATEASTTARSTATEASATTAPSTGAAIGAGPAPSLRPWQPAAIVGAIGAIVTASAASVRIGRGYHYDEAVTISEFVSSGSPVHAFTSQVVVNNHPLFSAIQAVVWRTGGTTEATQRITPILFAALAVAALGYGMTRRLGVLAGATSVVVLGLDATFIAQARQIRGYSLAVLGVTIAMFALANWIGTRNGRWLLVHGAGAAVAVMTHPYSVIAIAVMAAAIAAAGRVDKRLLTAWIVAGTVTVALLTPILDDTMSASRDRGRRFRPEFPLDALSALLGPGPVAAIVTGALVALGGVALARRSRSWRRAIIAGCGVAVLTIGTVWLVLRPLDLYPRFLVSILPLIAVGAAVGAWRAGPRVGTASIVVLAIASVPSLRAEISFEPGIRDAAITVEGARGLGLAPCGRNVLPLRAYIDPPPRVNTVVDLEGCEVVVLLGRTPDALSSAAEERYPQRWTLSGGITVHSTVSQELLLGPG